VEENEQVSGNINEDPESVEIDPEAIEVIPEDMPEENQSNSKSKTKAVKVKEEEEEEKVSLWVTFCELNLIVLTLLQG